MSDERICPECGADNDDVEAARARWQKTGEAAAIEIMRLKVELARVAEAEPRRNRKLRAQANVIRRLEKRIQDIEGRPYADFKLSETSPVTPGIEEESGKPHGMKPYPRDLVLSHNLRKAKKKDV